MWNSVISSRYTHLLTAITLTLAVGLSLLMGYPEKSEISKSRASVPSTRLDDAPKPSAQHSNSALPVEAFFDYTLIFPEQPEVQVAD